MGPLTSKSVCTPDELISMSDEKYYELVDGELVEKNIPLPIV